MSEQEAWPELPLSDWAGTCDTLHRWTQIVGKVRMALTPLVNHWWNVTFYVTSRGLSTSSIAYGSRSFDVDFDFLDHRLFIKASDGVTEELPLKSGSVAGFYSEFMQRLGRLGIEVHIWTMPSEIENAIPFDKDVAEGEYDPIWAQRFFQVLRQSDRLLKDFRSGFIGKVSPVHFFWGGFDMAVTRFSGRTAPPPTSKIPNVAQWVMAEAYSHEVSSCGFWPGNGGYGKPAFYAYAYPEPPSYSEVALRTADGYYDRDLGQFLLPYDAVRQAADPDALLLGFLQETYAAAANRAHWNRDALERRSAAPIS
jgi:hypothetical protein